LIRWTFRVSIFESRRPTALEIVRYVEAPKFAGNGCAKARRGVRLARQRGREHSAAVRRSQAVLVELVLPLVLACR
jgi:hypothetical protein